MNYKNPKYLFWLYLVKPYLQSDGKIKFFKARQKNPFICFFLILILMTNFHESYSAQSKLWSKTGSNVEIVSFDWFAGRDWNSINEHLNNSWKNFNFDDRRRDFRSVLDEDRKFLANQKEGFIYELTIQNNSPQKITTLSWEYVFKNPLNGEILGIHQFISRQQIKPNERKTLFAFSNNPPTNVITIELLQRNAHRPYLESAAINSVSFLEMPNSKTKNGF